MMGGGNTPQQGPAEEQPNFYQPSGGSRFHGGGSNTPSPSASPRTSPRPSPSSVPSASPFPAGQQVVLSSSTHATPSAITLPLADAVTIRNGFTSTLTVGIRRPGETILLERDIASNGIHRFRFIAAGTYELVIGTNKLVTITVQ
jgi:hypothetical protein